jgi:manganese-dependent ADP-ribose/CDP-alcohol diphosphatase
MRQTINLRILLLTSLILMGMLYTKTSGAQIKIGVFADCQYCDCETAGNRYYRNSLSKLTDCIAEFNQNDGIEFVVGLGDLIDRDYSSFAQVNLILDESEQAVFQVTGNHDLSVEKQFIDKVPEQLNLDKTYYSFNKKGWQFIFLNGNEITLQSTNPKIVDEAKKIIKQLSDENKPNNKDWNGGISTTQTNWLKQELRKAEKTNKKVVLFCHYPLIPFEAHALWNSEEILAIINDYGCVKAWINGHNHAGDYAMLNGIHFITFKGMVDTEKENAFSIVSFLENKIEVEGFGREVNRSLDIK